MIVLEYFLIFRSAGLRFVAARSISALLVILAESGSRVELVILESCEVLEV